MLVWGLKTEAAFDVWSIQHLMMGVSLACIAELAVNLLSRRETMSEALKVKFSFIIVFLCAAIWEIFEHYVELGLLGGKVAHWFQGQEHWTNRLIFDNVMVMLGWFVFQKNNRFVWFARVFSCVWLFFHIAVFPHSMYLHELWAGR